MKAPAMRVLRHRISLKVRQAEKLSYDARVQHEKDLQEFRKTRHELLHTAITKYVRKHKDCLGFRDLSTTYVSFNIVGDHAKAINDIAAAIEANGPKRPPYRDQIAIRIASLDMDFYVPGEFADKFKRTALMIDDAFLNDDAKALSEAIESL